MTLRGEAHVVLGWSVLFKSVHLDPTIPTKALWLVDGCVVVKRRDILHRHIADVTSELVHLSGYLWFGVMK